MRTEIILHSTSDFSLTQQRITVLRNAISIPEKVAIPEILVITSFPPRECGIATYSQDLISSLNKKFGHSFDFAICALESETETHTYNKDIKFVLNVDEPNAFTRLAGKLNIDENIKIVLIQHEFGFFESKAKEFEYFLDALIKPVIVVFHTVLPQPDILLKEKVQHISNAVQSLIVMTNASKQILIADYGIAEEQIIVIPHGTHFVPHHDKEVLKEKYQLSGKKVLSTFGLLSLGKSIETTLDALPRIVKEQPETMFLIIGKTHPTVVKQEGEQYRRMLEEKVEQLEMQDHVRFVNHFLPLPELLEYLQLTDIYLFTSKDPNQAVSGTFSYAIACGCPIISTPIPHAREVLRDDVGIIVDFQNPEQLADAVTGLLTDDQRRKNISSNGLYRMASTAWENSAIAHAMLFEKIGEKHLTLKYILPPLNLNHIKRMTTEFGMIQFSKINQPDIDSGYTLDDNARAMISVCQHFELTSDYADIEYISTYLNFIKYCLQPDGNFLNYVNEERLFTEQNHSTNLADSNGRAIWALGHLISLGDLLPQTLLFDAKVTLQKALPYIQTIHSPRAMAFAIKGLYFANIKNMLPENLLLIRELADRLVQMYRHESESQWEWFESYLTYANSVISEALLCAYSATGAQIYKEIAKSSFEFLLSKTFTTDRMQAISNQSWLHKGDEPHPEQIGGEQPIDIAYTILALSKFYIVFGNEDYLKKMETAFTWFLGNNHLHQVIYNPCTGGCYDGIEESSINLNQGAESTVSYLMARLTMEKTNISRKKYKIERPFVFTAH